MRKKIISTIIVIILLVAFAATISIEWLYNTFGNLTMDEIVFHLKVPMQGTNTDMVWLYIRQCLLKIVIPTGILAFILIYPMMRNLKIGREIHTSERKRTIFLSFFIATMVLVVSINKIVEGTDIVEYIESQKNDSKFIENEYVDPETAELEFPAQKRNLIYIFLESMETTYYAKEDGGLSENDLIPEITKLAKENITFSDESEIGGAYALNGSTWTAGAMTAHMAGVPLKLSVEGNALSEYSTFLDGAHSMGEILEENGYNNFLLLGSDATFGGRRNLFTQHGNYEIWDFESALAENKVNEKIWWGFTDEQLLEFSKEKILELSEREEPFNFVTLTTDTHFPDGYLCEDCPNIWDEQYKNVISCSSKMVGDFVNWIKEQDFYDNTTIVIAGDHLTMQKNFFVLEEGQDYKKRVVSIIINPAVEEEYTIARQYSTFDLYPTTLAALGVKINGERLALGTNLFSSEQTLIEKYGRSFVNGELSKLSKFYNNNILVEK